MSDWTFFLHYYGKLQAHEIKSNIMNLHKFITQTSTSIKLTYRLIVLFLTDFFHSHTHISILAMLCSRQDVSPTRDQTLTSVVKALTPSH